MDEVGASNELPWSMSFEELHDPLGWVREHLKIDELFKILHELVYSA